MYWMHTKEISDPDCIINSNRCGTGTGPFRIIGASQMVTLGLQHRRKEEKPKTTSCLPLDMLR